MPSTCFQIIGLLCCIWAFLGKRQIYTVIMMCDITVSGCPSFIRWKVLYSLKIYVNLREVFIRYPTGRCWLY
ncbi:hypothetical protein EDB19DRAFT_995949 [Suillus lakei]|nr:hypothetical protein EDB19DRAFT_995949 [Suillus lakei]